MTDAEQPDWVIYSETTKRYQSRGLRAGRMVRPAPQIEPDRWSHAVEPGADVTLCGRTIEGLHDYSDRVFRNLNPNLRCRECNRLAGNPSPR